MKMWFSSRILITLLIVLTVSCTDRETNLFLTTSDAQGITDQTKVRVKGLEIGGVTEISLMSNGEVLVEVRVWDEVAIPTDSKFQMESLDLFGTIGIAVILGKETAAAQSSDTFLLYPEPPSVLDDSTITGLERLLKQLTGAERQDSILRELQRLNENLEQMQEDRLVDE